ncbi:sulfotransferase [Rhodobacter sp. 24-YEA-8]|uniref:sulfotransferase n=1 Tax=Rhodobacter sp. 24-YEA-8 TaxID=1884310 RepID=UPI0008963FA5|nr:sulfotransferase [Rhodobacter sp. 24-YEA-8]SEC59954.1 Sulfotransferase family protein [Rhodobacter sp. 24-YEA-8]
MAGAFILGSARCGSTLVSDLIRLHPELLSLSEVFSTAGARAFPPGQLSARRFWRGLAEPTRIGALAGNPLRAPREFLYGCQERNRHDPFRCPPLLQVALPHLTDAPDDLFDQLAAEVAAFPRQSVADHYRQLFGAMAMARNRRLWVERSGGSLVATRTLARLFPEARLVLLTRSGPETVLSMSDYPATRLAARMWQRMLGLGIDLLDPDSHYGRGRIWRVLQALSVAMPVTPMLDKPADPLLLARFWSAMVIRGAHALAALPHARWHHLSYEALVAAPEAELAALALYLDVSAPAGWLREAGARPEHRPSRADRLAPAERARLIAACAPGEAALAALIRR